MNFPPPSIYRLWYGTTAVVLLVGIALGFMPEIPRFIKQIWVVVSMPFVLVLYSKFASYLASRKQSDA